MTPITRKEFYLAKLTGDDVIVPDPVTREEVYLANLCGEDVEIPDPVTITEVYLAAMCGMEVEVPPPVTRLQTIWAGILGADIPEMIPYTREEFYWMNISLATYLTVVGNPVSFTARNAPLKQLKVAFSPKQDLHGYDSPWHAGGGKNLFNLSADNIYKMNGEAGWTYTINGDTLSVVVTAAASNWMRFKVFEITQDMVGKKYVQSCITNPVDNDRWFTQYDPSAGTDSIIYANPVTISQDMVGKWLGVHFKFTAVGTYSFSKIQVEAGSTATSYAPYSNICPILGWDSLNVEQRGKNLFHFTAGRSAYTWGDGCGLSTISAGDYSVTLNGTASAIHVFTVTGFSLELPAGKYTASLSTYSKVRMVITSSGGESIASVFDTPITFTLLGKANLSFTFNITSGASFDNEELKIQIEQGETSTEIVPYTGRSISITLGQTVYSGTVDVVTGQGVDNKQKHTFSAGDVWTYYDNGTNSFFYLYPISAHTAKLAQTAITENGVELDINGINGQVRAYLSKNPFLSADTDMASFMATYGFVYELATPITIQLTPQEVESLAGDNTLWSDANQPLTVTYRSN